MPGDCKCIVRRHLTSATVLHAEVLSVVHLGILDSTSADTDVSDEGPSS